MDATTGTRPDARNVEWVLPAVLYAPHGRPAVRNGGAVAVSPYRRWTRTVLDLESDLQTAE